MSTNFLNIRDPIHGAISVSLHERRIIDAPEFQRLRFIKQLGFAEYAFPGATHTRYSHSLGAMFFATRIFDALNFTMSDAEHKRLRQALRLASMLHDIGHAPLSHTTEKIMPDRSALFSEVPPGSQATHEDYTEALILHSSLGHIIEEEFAPLGITSAMIAALLKKSVSDYFVVDNIDYGPLLSQIISSEIDADRMDYLLRDSLFCGVKYGGFDHDWVIGNLIIVRQEQSAFLGIKARAIFAFEDFLLSRYHMFVSVYLHHTPVIMEKMLARYFAECGQEFTLPSTLSDYVALDDMDLWRALRQSKNQWAERIVMRKPYVLLKEQNYAHKENARWEEELAANLKCAGIDSIVARSKSRVFLSHKPTANMLYVEKAQNDLVPLEDFSMLFSRYQEPVELVRIFVEPEQRDLAREVAGFAKGI